MHALNVTKVEKAHSIPDALDYLAVSFEIVRPSTAKRAKKGAVEVVHSGTHGFPLESTEEEIREALGKLVSTFLKDAERAEANAKVEATHRQADEVIANLSGAEITPDAPESS